MPQGVCRQRVDLPDRVMIPLLGNSAVGKPTTKFESQDQEIGDLLWQRGHEGKTGSNLITVC
jgi:hypothetical protein